MRKNPLRLNFSLTASNQEDTAKKGPSERSRNPAVPYAFFVSPHLIKHITVICILGKDI